MRPVPPGKPCHCRRHVPQPTASTFDAVPSASASHQCNSAWVAAPSRATANPARSSCFASTLRTTCSTWISAAPKLLRSPSPKFGAAETPLRLNRRCRKRQAMHHQRSFYRAMPAGSVWPDAAFARLRDSVDRNVARADENPTRAGGGTSIDACRRWSACCPVQTSTCP